MTTPAKAALSIQKSCYRPTHSPHSLTVQPVSYTHLDVYKRQKEYHPGTQHEAVPACSAVQCAYHHEQSLHFIGQPDVYKRQDVAWMDDGWTVVTEDGSLASHYENTILITDGDPEILSL